LNYKKPRAYARGIMHKYIMTFMLCADFDKGQTPAATMVV